MSDEDADVEQQRINHEAMERFINERAAVARSEGREQDAVALEKELDIE
jgi:hypothetical protein